MKVTHIRKCIFRKGVWWAKVNNFALDMCLIWRRLVSMLVPRFLSLNMFVLYSDPKRQFCKALDLHSQSELKTSVLTPTPALTIPPHRQNPPPLLSWLGTCQGHNYFTLAHQTPFRNGCIRTFVTSELHIISGLINVWWMWGMLICDDSLCPKTSPYLYTWDFVSWHLPRKIIETCSLFKFDIHPNSRSFE